MELLRSHIKQNDENESADSKGREDVYCKLDQGGTRRCSIRCDERIRIVQLLSFLEGVCGEICSIGSTALIANNSPDLRHSKNLRPNFRKGDSELNENQAGHNNNSINELNGRMKCIDL